MYLHVATRDLLGLRGLVPLGAVLLFIPYAIALGSALVPLLGSDLRRFEGAVSRFIKKQPESERRNEGLGRVLRRSSWRRSLKAASTGLPARLQQLTYWYQISTFWNLAFPSGKPIQVFVRALEYRKTLSSMINAENASPDPQLFSRLVLAP